MQSFASAPRSLLAAMIVFFRLTAAEPETLIPAPLPKKSASRSAVLSAIVAFARLVVPSSVKIPPPWLWLSLPLIVELVTSRAPAPEKKTPAPSPMDGEVASLAAIVLCLSEREPKPGRSRRPWARCFAARCSS